ncbi:YdcF family protein [Microbacterium sp.]|uniref:YdcF family protein n=1 Tax=Microbacterium sp. TaxID=51671 RepID=UPI00260C8B15|nr:YdcF family protein [Microbacterium sp.]
MSKRGGLARRLFWTGFAAYTAAAAWAEWVHWRSSHRLLGNAPTVGHEVVVVLGYGNRGERANFVNRYRVRAGIRSRDRSADSIVIMCGGTVEGAIPEAEIMQRYAREELGFTGRILLEAESRSTQENIENVIGLLEHAGTIKIVSNSPHAEVAREYLWQLRPDLAQRLVRADEHRLGEIIPMKIAAAVRLLLFRLQQR